MFEEVNRNLEVQIIGLCIISDVLKHYDFLTKLTDMTDLLDAEQDIWPFKFAVDFNIKATMSCLSGKCARIL